jgi:hypothetical protein
MNEVNELNTIFTLNIYIRNSMIVLGIYSQVTIYLNLNQIPKLEFRINKPNH